MSQVTGKQALLTAFMDNAMNVASAITNAINFEVDLGRAKPILTQCDTQADETLANAQELSKIALKDGYNILSNAIKEFPDIQKEMNQYLFDQSAQASAGYRMTASVMSLNAQLYAQAMHYDLYNQLILDAPKDYIVEKVKRWYNSAYTMTQLPLLSAITAFKRSTSKYNENVLSQHEIDQIFLEYGFTEEYKNILIDEVEQYPNIRSAMREASMYPAFTDDTIAWLCSVNNITMPQMIEFYQKLMHVYRLRTEYDYYVNTYLKQAYLDGLIEDDDYIAESIAHNVSDEEAQQADINMGAEFDRNLTRSEVQTQTWLYRKGETLAEAQTLDEYKSLPYPAEQLFYDRLIALGIDATWCNALVRLEAAKLGLDWEHS